MSHWLQNDVDTFLRDFGETVTVIDGDVRRDIKAIVDRIPPGLGRDGVKLENRVLLEVANDPVKGVPLELLKLGRLRIRVARRIGETPAADGYQVGISDEPGNWQDEGMLSLLVK